MKFAALATDYDGTIAQHGDVPPSTHQALRRWKENGHKLILVTGRELPDLARVCPFIDLFDRVIAENGAVLFHPTTGHKQILATPPPEAFANALRMKGVSPLSLGDVIVATQETYKGVVLETIEELGLTFKIILNKGSLMILPCEVDKATGLLEALRELKLTPTEVVGAGDAENDQAFLGTSRSRHTTSRGRAMEQGLKN
jgi:hydroxymethylpyrimidine pyrophosphatase-like HAD family hydrolase